MTVIKSNRNRIRKFSTSAIIVIKRGIKKVSVGTREMQVNNDKEKSNEAHCCYFTENARKSKGMDNLWCLDSGCTSHLCSDKSPFTNTSDKNGRLKLANNSETHLIGKGDVNIAIANNPNGVVTLKDTLFVPDLRSNLMSIAKIVDRGHEVTFQKSRAVVTDQSGKTMLIAQRIGDLFYLCEREQRANVVSEDVKLNTDVEMWHTRLRHLNARDLSILAKDGNVNGLKLKTTV